MSSDSNTYPNLIRYFSSTPINNDLVITLLGLILSANFELRLLSSHKIYFLLFELIEMSSIIWQSKENSLLCGACQIVVISLVDINLTIDFNYLN